MVDSAAAAVPRDMHMTLKSRTLGTVGCHVTRVDVTWAAYALSGLGIWKLDNSARRVDIIHCLVCTCIQLYKSLFYFTGYRVL